MSADTAIRSAWTPCLNPRGNCEWAAAVGAHALGRATLHSRTCAQEGKEEREGRGGACEG